MVPPPLSELRACSAAQAGLPPSTLLRRSERSGVECVVEWSGVEWSRVRESVCLGEGRKGLGGDAPPIARIGIEGGREGPTDDCSSHLWAAPTADRSAVTRCDSNAPRQVLPHFPPVSCRTE